MFLSLSDLAQSPDSFSQSTTWRTESQKIVTLYGEKDWIGLSKAAEALSLKAATAGANSLSTAADALNEAVRTKDTATLEKAVTALSNAARVEDVATVYDRSVNEELIGNQIDSLQTDITAFAAAHGGFMSAWDALKGGPDLTPLKKQADSINKQIARLPLTIEGRRMLVDRVAEVSAKIKPGDWKLIVGGTVATLTATWLATKAIQSSAAAAAAAVQKKLYAEEASKKPGKKKLKKAKK